MTHDWATSPTTMVRRRHELVRLAPGEESRLVVDPEGHVHIVANQADAVATCNLIIDLGPPDPHRDPNRCLPQGRWGGR